MLGEKIPRLLLPTARINDCTTEGQSYQSEGGGKLHGFKYFFRNS